MIKTILFNIQTNWAVIFWLGYSSVTRRFFRSGREFDCWLKLDPWCQLDRDYPHKKLHRPFPVTLYCSIVILSNARWKSMIAGLPYRLAFVWRLCVTPVWRSFIPPVQRIAGMNRCVAVYLACYYQSLQLNFDAFWHVWHLVMIRETRTSPLIGLVAPR